MPCGMAMLRGRALIYLSLEFKGQALTSDIESEFATLQAMIKATGERRLLRDQV